MDLKSKFSGMLLSWRSLFLRPFWASSSDLNQLGQGDTTSSSSMHSDSIQNYKYDVFISFRGPDTRNTFVDHLYNHLIRKGIFTFKDDTRLQKGESISPQLLLAIKSSRVSIVVFSKTYAQSTWCLDEMATIAECCQELKQIVFPVFYDVDPSHVRNQNGVYKNAFVLHTQKFTSKVDRWKRAMKGLAELVGWDVRKKLEFQEIEKIVQAIIKTLGHKFSGFADDLIGIQPRVEALESLLKSSSKDDEFRVLGIWGMGGIGKTTLATVLYDRISYRFDACCFIENVSKTYTDGGAIAIQKQILRQTINETNLETYSHSEISGIVRNRLHNIKLLVVLDDVDKLEQLEEIVINPKLIHLESRMIITTRDKHILEVYGAQVVHNVLPLSYNDARELFHRKAFKSDDHTSGNVVHTNEVLRYAQGLPLAVKVVGSFLCARDATQWRDALARLRNNPVNKIMNVLQISFEGLESEDKEIFLHIACFFEGKKEDYVKRILDACGLHPHIGIQNMINKSLLSIRNQAIHMHEMLQELGKKIVRQQFPEEPGLWSRLWLYQDFHHVMNTETGTDKVKAIILDQKEDISKCPELRAKGLSIMRGLIILILYHKNFSGGLYFLSNSLRYLLWHGYPFASLPLNFEPFRLVELNLSYSNIQRLWEGRKYLPDLKRVDLSNSKYLKETPNFEGSRNIERLDFTGCIKLSLVHPSIGFLDKLAFLSLESCSSLVSLDLGTAAYLYSLKVLHLSGCTELIRITPNFTSVPNLEYLDIDQCRSLSKVDQSIGCLTKLKFLSLRDCTNLVSIPERVNAMTSLVTLDLCGCLELENLLFLEHKFVSSDHLGSLNFLDVSFCNLSKVPEAIGLLRCLERLNLEGNNFVSLPSSMGQLSKLAYLNLAHCNRFQFFPELQLCATASSGGRYFKTISGSHHHRSGLYIFNCPFLEISKEGQNLALLWLERLIKNPWHFRCGFDIVVPGNIIPRWFDHQFMGGSRVKIGNSVHEYDSWLGFAFSVAFEENYRPTMSGSQHYSFSSLLPCLIYLSFESEHTEETFNWPLQLDNKVDGSNSEHLWLIYISRPHCHFMTTGAYITFKARPGLEIKKWGLRMVFEQDDFKPLKSSSSFGPETRLTNNWLLTDNVHESSNTSGSKFQLPYNWYITEEEKNEKMEVNAKNTNLSNMGLCDLPNMDLSSDRYVSPNWRVRGR